MKEGSPSNINALIKQIAGVNLNLPIAGVVTAINGDTCTVKINDEFEIEDVKLKATSGGENYIRLIPKINSNVLMISLTGKLENLSVIKYDQIEKVDLVQDEFKISIDSKDQKILIENSDCSLKDLMQDLTDLLKSFQVYTPVGASGVPITTTMTKINDFETKFKTLLK